MSECTACTAPSADARLCLNCRLAVKADLDDIAGLRIGPHGNLTSLLDELETAHTRQARIAGPAGRRGGDAPLPYHSRAGEDWVRLRDVVMFWSGTLSGQRQIPLPAPGIAVYARWLAGNVDELAQLEDAADALREFASVCERARRTINRPPDRRYVGPCEDCGADLYVPALGQGRQVETVCCRNRVPDPEGGEEWVPCGAEYPMQARRAWLLEQAYDRLLTAAEMSRAIRELIEGRPVSPNTISQWASRGQHSDDPEQPGRVYLTRYLPHPRDRWKRPRFRVEEVIQFARRAYVAEQRRRSA